MFSTCIPCVLNGRSLPQVRKNTNFDSYTPLRNGRCWREADMQRPTPVCLRTRFTQRIARNFLERRTSLDPLPFGCYRWQNRYLARATSQRLCLRLAIALG